MKLIMMSALLATAVSAVPAVARPQHWHDDAKHWNKHRDHETRDAYDRRAADCRFGPRDVRIIREYYEPRYRSLPPGLAKKYYRSGHLPPGWQKKMQPLPVAVERRLVELPRGYRRGYIDGAVVVYTPDTQIVIDVVTPFRP